MPRMTASRPEQRQQTRAKLIDAALGIFGERGYDHATVEDISEAAGYSKGAYYFHFDSKEDVFLELVETWIEEQTQRLLAFRKGTKPAALTLIETLQSFVGYDNPDRRWRELLPEIWAQSHRDRNIQNSLQAAYNRWSELLQDMLATADREGLISLAVQANVAASLILAAHDGLALRSRLKSPTEREFSVPQVASTLVALIAPSDNPATLGIPASVKRTGHHKT